ncbi:FUSC family protein [Streptomyces sp. NPDC002896]|uniref:FUSC family protein n=1 Tax=Streptomyces sp. NPDC002896 TaxID=3154438 RepID=UPI00331EBB26
MPPGAVPASAEVHRRLDKFLRQLTHSFFRQLKDFFRFTPAPGQWRTALRTSLVMAASVLTITAVAGMDVGPMALFGSLLALWNTGRPLRSRLITFAVVGLVFTGSMALGVLVAPVPWLIVPTITAVVLISVLTYYAFVISPGPGPLNLFFACALGTYLGGHTDKGWEIVAVTAASCTLTSLLSLSDLVRRPRGPEETAVSSAHAAVEGYLGHPSNGGPPAGENELRALRDGASTAVHRAWATLHAAHGSTARSAVHRRLETRLLETEERLAARLVADHFPGRPAAAHAVREQAVVLGRPPARYLLRHALSRHSRARLTAVRNALAAGIAALAAQLTSIGHPYWAVLSSTVVLHAGADRGSTTRRAVHRLLGTCAGVLVVAGVYALHPGRPLELAIMLIGVYGMNLLLVRQYSLAVVCVTAMAMMANTTTSPGLSGPGC